MLKWYEDNKIGIYFDKMPNVQERYPTPWADIEIRKEIYKKPFICNSDLEVKLVDFEKNLTYEFKIPCGYTYDGASIPRVFWSLIGSKTDNRFLIPALIHDVLCENHKYVNYDRYFSTKVFERLLFVSGISNFKRWLMFHSVDNFQKFSRWKDD